MDLSWGPTTAVREGEMVIEVFTRYWRGNEIGDKERVEEGVRVLSELSYSAHAQPYYAQNLSIYEIKCILNKQNNPNIYCIILKFIINLHYIKIMIESLLKIVNWIQCKRCVFISFYYTL